MAELHTTQRVMKEFLSVKVIELKGVAGFDTLLKTWIHRPCQYNMSNGQFLVDVVTSFQAAVQMRFIILQDQLRHDVKSPSETVINCEDIISETLEQLSLRSNLSETILSLQEWQQLLSSGRMVLGVLVVPVKEKYFENLANKQKEYAQKVFEMTVKQGEMTLLASLLQIEDSSRQSIGEFVHDLQSKCHQELDKLKKELDITEAMIFECRLLATETVLRSMGNIAKQAILLNRPNKHKQDE